MEFTARLMQYIGGDPDLGFGWSCSSSCGSGSSCGGGGGGGGKAIWEREPTALT